VRTLAVNARDAMPHGGRLVIEVDNSHLDHDYAALFPDASPGEYVMLRVRDNGHGMDAATLARVFEPFFTTKEVGKGTGLGLSQVFGFAKQSGGDVDVSSSPGRGTTFTLYLPQAEDAPDLSAAPRSEETGLDGASLCVLVVEDNIEVGRFATQILEDLGYETSWAANAEEALDRLGSEGADFDVVFSDVVMPGMGGLALAQELRRRMPRLPVLLASGYSHVLAQDGTHGLSVLHKPYSAEQLGRLLRQVTAPKRDALSTR